jgi:putative two-component system response regulator
MQTILVVDDHLDLCKPMTALLKRLGYSAFYATGGEAALAFVHDTPTDLVILDVMMPDMDGLEVLRRLKADPHTQGSAVVMFSAVADPEFRKHALSKGAVDFWIKANVDFSQLRQRITDVLPPA